MKDRILSDKDLNQIAIDIMDHKVLTSNDLWRMSQGDEGLYLHLLKKTFSYEALKQCMGDIVNSDLKKEHKDHLYFAYLTDQDEEKGFTRAYFIYGDDYRRLVELLTDNIKAFLTH